MIWINLDLYQCQWRQSSPMHRTCLVFSRKYLRLWYHLLHVASPVCGQRWEISYTDVNLLFKWHLSQWNMELSKNKQTFEVLRHAQKQNANVLVASQALRFGDVSARARGKVPRLLRWDELKYLVAAETESTAGVRRSKVRSCPRCRLPPVCLIGGRHSY